MNPSELAAALRVHPLIAEVLVRRGYGDPQAARAFLDPAAYAPTDPFELPGMARAVQVLRDAIAQRRKVRVWGDFDADGQTATAVLLIGLRALGAMVDFTIPDRARHSHGLHEDGILQAAADGVSLLLTCDCGIAEFERVALARQHGMSVIVTDHHDPAHDASGCVQLPPADAVLNPKLLPSDHPFATLPGVGVAWLLIAALARHAITAFDPRALLDLVAIGIVADVAVQHKETRYLLQLGLQRLRQRPRLGLRVLMRSAGAEPATLTEETIGFKLAPRLNAAGRLRTADLGVRLLTSEDEAEAAILASEIEALNLERQTLQQRIEQEALAMLTQHPALAQGAVIVLDAPHWHPSLIGVAASAVVGATGKPAILIASPPDALARASARSVEGVDIHAAIAAQSHLIESGGGHPMAAGFSIRAEHIPAFREAINRAVAQQLAARSEPPPVEEAFTVAWREVDLPLATQIEQLAPFGAGNPCPLLRCDALRVANIQPLGEGRSHVRLHLHDSDGHLRDALWWGGASQPLPPLDARVALTFTLRRSVFRGVARAQVVVQALHFDSQHLRAAPQRDEVWLGDFVVRDARQSQDWREVARALAQEFGAEAVQVWGDGEGAMPRSALRSRPVLVIAAPPPGSQALAEALARAQPQVVALACRCADADDDPQHLLTAVAGMIKVAQRRGDDVNEATVIARMAARVNQRDETIRAAVRFLLQQDERQRELLRALLRETRAWRRFACQAPAEAVLRAGTSLLAQA